HPRGGDARGVVRPPLRVRRPPPRRNQGAQAGAQTGRLRGRGSPARRGRSTTMAAMDARVVGRVAVALLAVVFTISGLRQAWADSPTVDEGVDLASGLTYWVHGDLRMSPEHPVLPKLLATAPALAAGPVVPKGSHWVDG